MKIDVCVVTKNGKLPLGLENIPINTLIVDESSPVGMARKKCIEQVTTPIFAFIDDDMEVSKTWFDGLLPFIEREKVGAVWGTITNKGLGVFDWAYGAIIPYGELRPWDRFNTNNSLIKTEIVKDWQPTIGLNCYEDLDLGFHIMGKGYKILNVPSDTKHLKGFIHVAKSAFWAGSRYKEAYRPTTQKVIKQWLKRLAAPIAAFFIRGLLSALIVAYRNIFFLLGIVWTDLEEMMKKR